MTTPPGELMYMKMGLSTDCASRYSSCVRRAHRGTGERRGEWCEAEAGPVWSPPAPPPPWTYRHAPEARRRVGHAVIVAAEAARHGEGSPVHLRK